MKLKVTLILMLMVLVGYFAACGGSPKVAKRLPLSRPHYSHLIRPHGKEGANTPEAPPPRRGLRVNLSATPRPVVPRKPTVTAIEKEKPWQVVYADSFGAPIGSGPGQDPTWKANGPRGNGCCGNGDEIAAETPDKVVVGPNGLEELCAHESREGKSWDCGGADTNTPAGPKIKYGEGRTFAIEWKMKAPPANNCAEDPGAWLSDPAWTDEFDGPELWGWNVNCRYSGGWVWIYKTPSSSTRVQCEPWEGCDSYIPHPDTEEHVYDAVIYSDGSFRIFIEGKERAHVGGASPNLPWEHLILTHALRVAGGSTQPKGASTFSIQYAAIYELGSGGVENARPNGAPGTTVEGATPPPPETTPTTTPTTATTPPPPPPSSVPAAPANCSATGHREALTSWLSTSCTPSSGATGYVLWRTEATAKSSTTKPGEQWTTGGSSNFSNHIGVKQGEEYCFWEAAENTSGKSSRTGPFCTKA